MKDYDSHKTQKSDIKNIIDNIDHETSKIVDYISLICLENPALLLNNDIFEKNIKAEDRIRVY
ncbi:hypothetical protein A3Q56_05745 [Intoshia linei]|uniref:Uncharacterized protein n=1 Tax=Intoshia linei TaxID=1819745 RepID=A0A177AYL1_9BILA|nr:hypothetical protein A3Q56_05745 [Intoshia linei]